MADEIEVPVMTDDQVLAFVQHKRKAIIQDVMPHGKVPNDRSEQALLIASLDGLSRDALGNKRIKADEKAAHGVAGAAGMIAEMLGQLGNLTNGSFKDLEVLESVEPPSLGDEVAEPFLVPGELETNAAQLNYESFMSSVTPKD
jgi:hypothetical protein